MKVESITLTKNQKKEMINGNINEFIQPKAGFKQGVSEGLPEAIFLPSLTLFNFAEAGVCR